MFVDTQHDLGLTQNRVRRASKPIELRPYQAEAIASVDTKFDAGAQSELIVLPTGGGKTEVFAAMAGKRAEKGQRTIIMVHRDELIRQAANKIELRTGIRPGIEKARERSNAGDLVVVASKDTLIGRKSLPGQPFSLCVIDEAHHATLDNTYGQILQRLKPRKLLGVTATPWRSDKKLLSEVFEDTAYSLSLMDLIKQKYLCDITIKTLPVKIDLSRVKTDRGDFNADDLNNALEPHLELLADLVARDYAGKKMLTFCPLRDTSRLWTEKLKARGLAAAHVDGDSPDRKELLNAFHCDEIRFLSNASLLTEGYDEPSIDTVFMLRPTRSRVMFSQMIGRGTRLFAGKDRLLVIDPVFISERHNILSVADVAAQEGTQSERVNEIMRKTGRPLAEAMEEEAQERRNALAEALRQQAHRGAYEKGIAELALTFSPDVQNFEPTHKWHEEKPSQKQVEMLVKCGIDPKLVSCKGVASILIDGVMKRRENQLATFKQVKMARRLGHENPEALSFDEASAWIGANMGRKAA